MDKSKLVVLTIGLFIGLGVFAWSWVNFTQSPPHDPEIAQRYFQHFHRRCPGEFGDEELCREVLGNHHRSCFADHLRPTPEDRVDEEGPFLYNRSLYLECMRSHAEALLQGDGS